MKLSQKHPVPNLFIPVIVQTIIDVYGFYSGAAVGCSASGRKSMIGRVIRSE